MSNLGPAHRGYEYQDLLAAYRLVDLLLGTAVEVRCDEKLLRDDRFDDLTTTDSTGHRERAQIKHSADPKPLGLDTFTTDARSLRLDHLLASILRDREGPGRGATGWLYRVVLRDSAPFDTRLTAVLGPAVNDPGPFQPGMRTTRLRFDPDALLQQGEADPITPEVFAFLFNDESTLTRSELQWTCGHLVIEIDAPPASLDLTAPALAEDLLLSRVRSDVGAESYPNADRSAVDVAAAFVSAARSARQGLLDPTTEELLRRARLRSDFGAVSRSHPVDSRIEVRRPTVLKDLVEMVEAQAGSGGGLLIVGPPGHGKSWTSHQLLGALEDGGWLVAEHYCYLGDADGERDERVLSEAVFGSLLGRLAEADSRLVTDQRPRFAADEDALLGCLRRAVELDGDRGVVLVVDGLDHITRVRSRSGVAFDPSRSMAEAIAAIDVPQGVVFVVLSQPGSHLAPLEDAGATTASLPGLDDAELLTLAGRLGLVPLAVESTSTVPLIAEQEGVTSFLEALSERSAGNALYATYLCRETMRPDAPSLDPADAVRTLPPFDGTLEGYYKHLYGSLESEAGWVADVIAILDFAVTRAELREIRPDAGHRVNEALQVLAPVLTERAAQGGVRVYHESFARFLRRPFQDDPDSLEALIRLITNWLEGKGLFQDTRAFRSLLPLLAEAGEDDKVVRLVDHAFVRHAVAACFPSSAINAGVATAVGAAARLGDWPTVVRYVELARASEAFQAERYDSTLVEFADVPVALLGAEVLAGRLLDDDRLVMSARAGLQMCAAIDSLGAPAPWRPYLDGFVREAESDNTSYGESSDRAVALASLRGQLRLAASSSVVEGAPPSHVGEPHRPDTEHGDGEQDDSAPDWNRVARWVEARQLPLQEVIAVVLDTHGWDGALAMSDSLAEPGDAYLCLAEHSARYPAADSSADSARVLATTASEQGIEAGSLHRLLALGVDPADFTPGTLAEARDGLLDLTRAVQERSVRWESGVLENWLDACALAGRQDPLGIIAAEALVAGEGWYPCWLRFVLALSTAEAATESDRGSLALDAIGQLTGDLRPFAGDPRACDLYPLHPTIADTLRRALGVLDDQQWCEAIRTLNRVSDSITTTMSGELGGPLPPDLLLGLAAHGATSARRAVAEELLDREISDGAAGRFYSDIAGYHLLAARLALAADHQARALQEWRKACVFLTAYGWHKDATIFEILDPLTELIEADPAAARVRIREVQGTCERIPLHTDGRGTNGIWSRWWTLATKADPVGVAHLVMPDLLARCNDPNSLLFGALEDLWSEWHTDVDPIVAGALRLSVDASLAATDADHIEAVANALSAVTPNSGGHDLVMWLLARIDERPVGYSYSNNAELLEGDDQEVERLNAVALTAGLPAVRSFREPIDTADASRSWRPGDSPAAPRRRTPRTVATHDAFPPGLPGLVRATRSWRKRPYDADSAEWDRDRFANAIGYRLIELTADGRSAEATSAIRWLAEGVDLGDRFAILRSVAEGLERHGECELAALCFTYAWTRTRGRGGWMNFGGETEIESLVRARMLDATVTEAAIAAEVERTVATSRYGTNGVSQALIHALLAGAIVWPGRSPVESAFAAWDQAHEVIASRTPWVAPSDDPDQPYFPPSLDGGEGAPGNLDEAFALAVLGGLAHPGRERKRRTLLAIQVLLAERPVLIASALAEVLPLISDPATLSWLLSLVGTSDGSTDTVRASAQPAFRTLAGGDFLTVRALARRLVDGETPLAASCAPPEGTRLLGRQHDVLWMPEGPDAEDGDDPDGVHELLESVAGARLEQGERWLPGLGDVVFGRVEGLLQDSAIKKRLDRQLDEFGDRVDKRWPNAFLAHEQAIEEVIQTVAAGARATRIMAGEPVADPVTWEDQLASALVNSPSIPLALEACRRPRPSVDPPPTQGREIWTQIRSACAGTPSDALVEADGDDDLLLATVSLEPVGALPNIQGGALDGWLWLGTMETRRVKRRDHNHADDMVAKRYRVLEVRDQGDRRALALPPVARGDLRLWRADVEPANGQIALSSSQPLLGVDSDLALAHDGRLGLGVPDSLLCPTHTLISVLGLAPSTPCFYDDTMGPALALALWRAEYDVSDYYLAWPRTCGSGVAIRPDLLERLVDQAGSSRLVLRDFVAGSIDLIG